MTKAGRALTVFWTIFSVRSVASFTSVVSARLTLDALAFSQTDSLAGLQPSDVCIEDSYPALAQIVADEFGIDTDLGAAGVLLTTVEGCVNALLSGRSTVYLTGAWLLPNLRCIVSQSVPLPPTDEPVLRFLAFAYLDTGRFYVSPILQSNPLSFAYPSGSGLRPLVDNTLIRMLGDTAWNDRRVDLQQFWFPTGVVSPPDEAPDLNVSMLIAALVVIFISAGITVAQSLQRAYKRRKLARAAWVVTAGQNRNGKHVTAAERCAAARGARVRSKRRAPCGARHRGAGGGGGGACGERRAPAGGAAARGGSAQVCGGARHTLAYDDAVGGAARGHGIEAAPL